jgi:hypothetical protein
MTSNPHENFFSVNFVILFCLCGFCIQPSIAGTAAGEDSTKIYGFGCYDEGTLTIDIHNHKQPIMLVLLSYGPVHWQINNPDAVEIKSIRRYDFYDATVSGVSDSMYYSTGPWVGYCHSDSLEKEISVFSNTNFAYFQSAYKPTSFSIVAENAVPTDSCRIFNIEGESTTGAKKYYTVRLVNHEKPLILCLSGYGAYEWTIENPENTPIKEIFLTSYEPSSVNGIEDTVPVIKIFPRDMLGSYVQQRTGRTIEKTWSCASSINVDGGDIAEQLSKPGINNKPVIYNMHNGQLAMSFPAKLSPAVYHEHTASIRIFNPLGRLTATVPLASNSGTTRWSAGMGFYLCKLNTVETEANAPWILIR